jgi:hypothetical protein
MSSFNIDDYVAETTKASGVPFYVADPEALQAAAALVTLAK